METISVTSLTILLLLVSTTLSSAAKLSADALFVQHSRVVYKFKCGTPQRRVVPLSQLETDVFDNARKIVPSATVLHRCDCSGFCNALDKECGPKKEERVELVFSVDGVLKFVTVKNHTECACVDRRYKPK